jgi:pyruvate/2-oxoglutarate dehydrogenase complex dihydrolipoamide dehydrogenase (E3) component
MADQEKMSVDGKRFDVFLVFYGWAPVVPLGGQITLETDERGFVRTDDRRRTSEPDVYAIGEIAHRLHPCVATSMSDGVVCAKDIQQRLEQAG